MKPTFTETQKFSAPWIKIPLGINVLYTLYLNINTFVNLGSLKILEIGTSILSIAIFLLFQKMELITEINQEGIKMKFYPFISKTFAFDQIESMSVIDYGFVGGWGIRLWSSYGTIYNVSGSKGLFIELKNGKKYVIGTEQEETLRNYIESIRA